jgi:hypothetical protein
LSHPLIVEIIEDYFIPLAIYNNIKGHDRTVLEYFSEPAWNNPVVRIVDEQGKDAIKRIAGTYTTASLLEGMLSALENRNIIIPTWMKLLQASLSPIAAARHVVFSTPCFWSGEAKLGSIEGVIYTRSGWMDRREVVEVVYDPGMIPLAQLTNTATHLGLAQKAYADNDNDLKSLEHLVPNVGRSTKIQYDDNKYHLNKTLYRYVPMTDLQATRINSALAQREGASNYLSPRQLYILEKVKAANGKNYLPTISVDIMAAMENLPQ